VIRLRLRARAVDLDVTSDARVLCLFGPSGSGKTTCLEAVAGLLDAEDAEIAIGGRRIDGLPPRARRVGYLPQDAPVFPHLDVRRNLVYGAPGRDPGPLAEALGIAHLLDRPSTQLSGGERRRLALGRAILVEPAVLLLDEPFSGLDAPLRARLLVDVARLDVPHVLLVTHDPRDALGLADEVVCLERGRAVARGAPEEVFGPGGDLVAPAALLRGTVTAVAPPYADVACGPLALHAHLPGARSGEAVRLAVRADEVTLALRRHDDLTARNQLPATIRALERRGAQLDVVLDAGVTLHARIDPRSADLLGLREGGEVVAQFKASSLRRAGV